MSREQSLSKMNSALRNFGRRWKLDGDYLRCAACERPHIASRIGMEMGHDSDCAYSDTTDNPWRTLLEILEPIAALTREAAPQASGDRRLMEIANEISRQVLHGATVDWRPNMGKIADELRRLATTDSAIQSQQGATGGDGRGNHGHSCGVNNAIVGECSCGLEPRTALAHPQAAGSAPVGVDAKDGASC